MIGKSNHPQIEREKAEVQRMARSSSSEEVVLDLKTACHNNEAKRQEGRGRAMYHEAGETGRHWLFSGRKMTGAG